MKICYGEDRRQFSGQALQDICTRQDMPLWVLAELCGVRVSELLDYILGQKVPSEKIIELIATALRIDSGSLYEIQID